AMRQRPAERLSTATRWRLCSSEAATGAASLPGARRSRWSRPASRCLRPLAGGFGRPSPAPEARHGRRTQELSASWLDRARRSDRANDLASAANAHGDFYRWVPELLPLVARFGLELQPTPGLWIRLPWELTALVPTTDRREVKGGLIARFEIEGQSKRGVGGG